MRPRTTSRRVFARSFASATALALAPTTSAAQVNVEPVRDKLERKGGVSVSLLGSMTGDTGNSEGIAASGAGQVAGMSGSNFAFVYGTADYTRFNAVTSVDKTFLHARYNYEIVDGLWFEAFGQLQSDKFERLLVRNLWGVGPRFTLFRGKEFDLFFGTAYMFEYDRITPAPGSNDAVNSTAQRSSNYLSLTYDLGAQIDAGTTVYYQPKFDDWGNFRVLWQTALNFKINTRLTSSVSYTLRYDSSPPTDVLRTDTEVKNTFQFTF